MEQRFQVRLKELLSDAEVPPGLLRGVLPRLEAFRQKSSDSFGLSFSSHKLDHRERSLRADTPARKRAAPSLSSAPRSSQLLPLIAHGRSGCVAKHSRTFRREISSSSSS